VATTFWILGGVRVSLGRGTAGFKSLIGTSELIYFLSSSSSFFVSTEILISGGVLMLSSFLRLRVARLSTIAMIFIIKLVE